MKLMTVSFLALGLMSSLAHAGQSTTQAQAQQMLLDDLNSGALNSDAGRKQLQQEQNELKSGDYDALAATHGNPPTPPDQGTQDLTAEQARQIIIDDMKNGASQKQITEEGLAWKSGNYNNVQAIHDNPPSDDQDGTGQAGSGSGSGGQQQGNQGANNTGAGSSGGSKGNNGSADKSKAEPPAQQNDDEANGYNGDQTEAEREAEALKNLQNNDEDAEKLSHDADPAANLPGNYDDALKLYAQMAELYQEFKDYEATANQDKLQEPQLDSNAGPGLPVHCTSMDDNALAAQYQAKKAAIAAGKPLPAEDPNAGQCVPCYSEAEENINQRRIAFERLRILLNYTQKMATQGENALSGFGAAGGSLATMEAQGQIRKVDESLQQFYAAYDGKYVEILAKMKTSLDMFAKCETKYFNNPDWYNRYGFMYYQFMADKYKRN